MRALDFLRERKSEHREGEQGAVIIEASIALPVFMFLMITLYTIIQIAYVQARMTIAVDSAAKELAEYAHVYYATGMNNYATGSGGKSSELANQVSEFLTTVGESLGSVDSELGQYVTDAGGALSGDSLADLAKYGMSQALGLQMMKKNMISSFSDNAEAFQKRNRITYVNMDGSKFLEKESKSVFLVANYGVRVIKLLNIDFTFDLRSHAYTEAWGGE